MNKQSYTELKKHAEQFAEAQKEIERLQKDDTADPKLIKSAMDARRYAQGKIVTILFHGVDN